MLEIPGAKLNGKKTSEKKFPKNLGIPREEILENAVPFATGSCRKFKPEVLESALEISSDLIMI